MGGRFIATATAVLLLFVSPATKAVEEAEYSVLRQDGAIEVREYTPYIVAETVVDGKFESAGSRAFRALFGFIDGDNTSRREIAMTAPVSQTAAPQKIAMTAPVTQARSAGGWAVRFVMPASFSIDTVPEPANPAVVIREVPAHRAVAIRYSGSWSHDRYQRHLEELQAWITEQRLAVAGEPVWARYNAPYVPWFLRRNEILVEVAGHVESVSERID